jgi:hypothetical protein
MDDWLLRNLRDSSQEAPNIDVEDNIDYLRGGKVKFNFQVLRLRYQEQCKIMKLKKKQDI